MDTRTITLVLCFLFLGLMAQAQRTEVRLKRVEQAPRPGAIILAESDSLAAWNDTLYWDGTVLWLDSARTITLPYLQDSILSGYADTTYAQSLVISTSLIQDSILTYMQNNAEIGRDTVRITWGNIQGIPADIADGDDDTQLSPGQVVGIARDTGFVERIELADTASVLRTYTDQAEADAKAYADANDDVDDADNDTTNELQNWGNLPGIPADIADGDDNTQLTPGQVVGIARDTGFVERLELADTASVLRTYTDQAEADAKAYADANDDVDDADADPTNELQNWGSLPGIPAGFADGIDDVGGSAEGTLYASITGDNDAVVSMTSNTDSADVRWHFTNASIANTWYMGLDGSDGKAFKWAWNSNDFSSPVLNIEPSGNIGINTTTPNELLHVDGGNIRMATASAGANRIIHDMDGQGTMEWATTSSLGLDNSNTNELQDFDIAQLSGSTLQLSLTQDATTHQIDLSSLNGGTGDITEVQTASNSGLEGGSTSGSVNISTNFSNLVEVNNSVSVIDANNDYFIMRTNFDELGGLNDRDAKVPMYDAMIGILEAGNNVTFSQNSTTGQLQINASISGSTGDITAVNPGDHLTGGGTSGSVTLNVDAESAYQSLVNTVQISSNSDQRFAFSSNGYRKIWYSVNALGGDITIDIVDPNFAPAGAVMVFAFYRDRFGNDTKLTLDVDGTNSDLHIAQGDTFSTSNTYTFTQMGVITLRRMRAYNTSGFVWAANYSNALN